MKIILVLTLIFIKAISQKILDLPENSSSNTKIDEPNKRGSSEPSIQKCTTNQIEIATKAVTQCDQIDFYVTASCIKKYILRNLNQRWNVFVRLSQNSDLPSYLVYDNCEVILRNKGKFNKTFILWPAISYPSSMSANNGLGKAQAPPTDPLEIQIQDQCPASTIEAVMASFSACDSKKSNIDAAVCIKQKIMNDLGENWNAWVSQKQSTTSFWFYDDCALFMPFYGTQMRQFSAWKASDL